MTYLAVQISLYLVSAALIGIGFGWFVWGQGRRRKIGALKSEMETALKAERRLGQRAQRDLEKADARLSEALDLEKANSTKAIGEIKQLFETEKKAALAARSEADQLRLDMDIAISAEKATAVDAIKEALENANGLKEALSQARIRETQVRAELEELRLMAGAEKLAAQTARSAFDRQRRDMEASLETERNNSAQAQQALGDIRATLARSFGGDQGVAAASTAMSVPRLPETKDLFDRDDASSKGPDEHIPANDAAGSIPEEFVQIIEPAILTETVTVSGIDANQGAKIAGEMEPGEASTDPVSDQVSRHEQDGNRQDDDDPSSDAANQPVQLRPVQAVEGEGMSVGRPGSFYDERPDDVDSLQAIGGIDPGIEKLLNDHGCYQYKQLADASADDIEWLARQFGDMPDLRERIERDGWIEQARELQAQKPIAANAERPRWWSRRRLR